MFYFSAFVSHVPFSCRLYFLCQCLCGNNIKWNRYYVFQTQFCCAPLKIYLHFYSSSFFYNASRTFHGKWYNFIVQNYATCLNIFFTTSLNFLFVFFIVRFALPYYPNYKWYFILPFEIKIIGINMSIEQGDPLVLNCDQASRKLRTF